MQAIDQLMSQSLRAWGVPGASIALVRENQPEYVAGYGLADIQSHQPVSPDSVFSIASNTKGFAAAACMLLVQDGKLNLDTPIRQFLPDFRLHDPKAVPTVRDILCHRTGLGRHDLLWYQAPWSIDEMIRRVGHCELSAPFRTQFQYNNLLYIVIGELISAAAGQPWFEYVRSRILQPLHMNHTYFSAEESKQSPQRSSQYFLLNDTARTWYEVPTITRASGSMFSSARDMTAWLKFQLSGGLDAAGQPLLHPTLVAEMHSPQISHEVPYELASQAGVSRGAYGLGWHLYNYQGHAMAEHSGTLGGFRAHTILLTQDGIAVTVLANLRRTNMVLAACRKAIDWLLGKEAVDWDTVYLQRESPYQNNRSQKSLTTEESLTTEDSTDDNLPTGNKFHPQNFHPQNFVASYTDAAYGNLRIDSLAGQLRLQWSSFSVMLQHRRDRLFEISCDPANADGPLDNLVVEFLTDENELARAVKFLGRNFVRCDNAPTSPNCDR